MLFKLWTHRLLQRTKYQNRTKCKYSSLYCRFTMLRSMSSLICTLLTYFIFVWYSFSLNFVEKLPCNIYIMDTFSFLLILLILCKVEYGPNRKIGPAKVLPEHIRKPDWLMLFLQLWIIFLFKTSRPIKCIPKLKFYLFSRLQADW